MKSNKLLLLFVVVFYCQNAFARDQIKIVGSSTVYPFSTVVGEEFGAGDFKTPVVESTGTGGGFQLFCQGVGPEFPDIANASRAIKDSEKQECQKHGVNDIIEFKFGNDGIAFVNNVKGTKLSVSINQLWKAMAAKGPKPINWNQISPELPNIKIQILTPPPTSGTRDAWNALVMEKGCDSAVKAVNPKDCELLREDGAVIEAGENDALIIKKLEANPEAFGIFGFSYLEENLDKVQAAKIDNVEISMQSIQNYSYSISRPLFFYVKKAHLGVIPGIAEFVKEFLSDDAVGNEGYLSDVGLVPLDTQALSGARTNLELIK